MSTSRFRFRWLLPASLTLNVFLCAALIAHLGWDRRHQPPPPPGTMLDQMARDLPPEDAQILRQSLAPSLSEIDKAHRAEEGLPQRLQAILGREPFDKAAFKELLVQSQRAREILNEVLPEAIEKLSPEGRRRLAVWRPPGLPGPHMGPPPDGPDGPLHAHPTGPPR
ncbi:periplasmic heavy metal sensor [Telmatospirillum sp.]|uniref:periplasmic heavy metal sensor n=1 Tax=Telmatospirillum sp. TaxID=2079197 RepID=UPI00284F7994|nr:periplasmic heavy metal sensor [Telmatospirillum sp.]MDR3436343.1 periplasmic heavy metal sensor [Telmatospirillum sp.]